MPLPTLIKSGFSILLGDVEDLRKQFINQLINQANQENQENQGTDN